MNFLAHAVLAGSTRQIVAGSLMGDFVKGVVYDGDYAADITLGIRLHRRIDAFSNSNEHLRRSAQRLPDSVRRIAPPCIDVLADHLLARAAQQAPQRWLPVLDPQDSSESAAEQTASSAGLGAGLAAYATGLHQIIGEAARWLSPEATRFFDHARTSALFAGYADFARASKGISYVCRRLGQEHATEHVLAAMKDQTGELTGDFERYWPELIDEANRFLSEHGKARIGFEKLS